METLRKVTKFQGGSQNKIFNFCDCDILAKVRKPQTPTAVYFLKCSDPFLVDEVTFMLSTGNITASCHIVNPDLPDRLKNYTDDGYSVEFLDSQLTIN